MKKIFIFLILVFMVSVTTVKAMENSVPGPGNRYSPPTNGLTARYSADTIAGVADGGKVATWKDLSGNGYNLTQLTDVNRPIWVASSATYHRPIVFFNGSANTFQQSLGTASFNFDRRTNTVVLITESGQTGQPITSDVDTQAYWDNGTTMYVLGWKLIGNDGWYNPGSGEFDSGIAHSPVAPSVEIVSSSTGGIVFHRDFFDGPTKAAAAAGTMTNFTLGNWGAGGAFFPSAQGIYEVLVYDHPLTAWDISRIRNYSRERYGTPLASRRLNIVHRGDSTTAGVGSVGGYNYPAQLAALGGLQTSALQTNLGANGFTLQTMATLTAAESGLYNSSYARNVAILVGGINDFNSGRTDAQALADVITYCNSVRAMGYRVIVTTVWANSFDTGQGNIYRQAFNTSLAAQWSTFADGFVDLANAGIALSDGTHPSNAGYTTMANAIYTVLAPML